MDSIPSLSPSTTSSLFASIKTITSCVGGRVPSQRNWPLLSRSCSRVSFHAVPVQAVEFPLPHQRQHPVYIVFNVRLPHPRPNRLHPIPQLQCDPFSPKFRPQSPHYTSRGGFLLSRLPQSGFPVFVQESVLICEVWNLQQTQDSLLAHLGIIADSNSDED